MSNPEKQARRFEGFLSKLLPGRYNYADIPEPHRQSSIINYMLARTQSMFEWQGLPETIPARILEQYLQINGFVIFAEHDGLHIYFGGLGGEPDVYYEPTTAIVANPAQRWDAELRIGEECIIMRNDSYMQGLIPMNHRYASAMVETETSMRLANINSRIISLISAQDDRTMKSAEKYIHDVEQGKLSIIAEQKLLEDLKTSPYAATGHNSITDLIELMQYYKASWYNEIGLNANYNMKRESINANESQLNNDALLPLVDDMLRMRKQGADAVNAMFGTSITVDYASAWQDNIEEIEAEQSALKGGESGESSPVERSNPE